MEINKKHDRNQLIAEENEKNRKRFKVNNNDAAADSVVSFDKSVDFINSAAKATEDELIRPIANGSRAWKHIRELGPKFPKNKLTVGTVKYNHIYCFVDKDGRICQKLLCIPLTAANSKKPVSQLFVPSKEAKYVSSYGNMHLKRKH